MRKLRFVLIAISLLAICNEVKAVSEATAHSWSSPQGNNGQPLGGFVYVGTSAISDATLYQSLNDDSGTQRVGGLKIKQNHDFWLVANPRNGYRFLGWQKGTDNLGNTNTPTSGFSNSDGKAAVKKTSIEGKTLGVTVNYVALFSGTVPRAKKYTSFAYSDPILTSLTIGQTEMNNENSATFYLEYAHTGQTITLTITDDTDSEFSFVSGSRSDSNTITLGNNYTSGIKDLKVYFTPKKFKQSHTCKVSISSNDTKNNRSFTVTATSKYRVKYAGNGNTAGDLSDRLFGWNDAVTFPSVTRTYTVTYNPNYSGASTSSVTATSSLDGWKYNRDNNVYASTATLTNLASNYTGSILFTAQWTLGSITLPDITRTGYTFAGWYSEPACSNKIGNAGSSFKPMGTTSLFAKWIANQYNITLNANGGKGGTTSVMATFDTAMPSITPASRSGYTLSGYFDSSNGGTKYYNADGTSAHIWDKPNNTTLWAQWSTNTYTITFDKRGGTGGSSSTNAKFDTALPAISVPSKVGYDFAGYYDAIVDGTQYYNKQGTGVRNWDKASATTLYAHWNPKSYNITFDANGGEGGTSSVTAIFDAPMPAITPAIRIGYILTGYYDSSVGGTKYYNADGTSALNWNTAANTTLFAQWNAIPYDYDLVIESSPIGPSEECIEGDFNLAVRIAADPNLKLASANYYWYRNGELVATNNSGKFAANEVGYYLCIVEGENFKKPLTGVQITCSEYPWEFDNVAEDNDWFNKQNWAPNRNRIPTEISNVKVLEPAAIATPGLVANANDITLKSNGSLTIEGSGRLAISGKVSGYNGDNITINADRETHRQGALTAMTPTLSGTITVPGFATTGGNYDDNVAWQYTAVPVSNVVACETFRNSWITLWTENSVGLGSCWSYISNYDLLQPFIGYALTQQTAKDYTMNGYFQLGDHTYANLSYHSDAPEYPGFNFLGNSYAAPIDIASLKDEDFVGIEKCIYLYHYGSWNAWNDSQGTEGISPGQYEVVPLHLAFLNNAVIPSMQGFFVQSTQNNGSLHIDYEHAVHNPNMAAKVVAPMAHVANRRMTEENDNNPIIADLSIRVSTEHYADMAKLFINESCSDAYDDGWDGRKVMGSENVPQVFFITYDGEWQYNVTNQLDTQYLAVVAGAELQTTLTFDLTEMVMLYDSIYLTDLTSNIKQNIVNMPQYTYTASEQGEKRLFLLSTYYEDKEVSGGTDLVNIKNRPDAIGIYDVLGRQIPIEQLRLMHGVYIVVDENGVRKEVAR